LVEKTTFWFEERMKNQPWQKEHLYDCKYSKDEHSSFDV
jgi:hypothetical protein